MGVSCISCLPPPPLRCTVGKIQLLDFFKTLFVPTSWSGLDLDSKFQLKHSVLSDTKLELQYKGSLNDSFISCGYSLLSVLFKNTKLLLWGLV